MFFTSRASRGSQAAAIFSSLGGEEISSEEVTTLCEKKTQKVKTSELTSTAPLLARQPSTGALLPNISAMFISTFLFLSVFYFYFYCYYFYLISQQCSSWSPESSAKSQQCPSLPRLTKGQLSSSNCALSTLYYEGTTTTHSTLLQEVQSVSSLSLPLVRSHLGTYDGLAPFLARGVVYYITI